MISLVLSQIFAKMTTFSSSTTLTLLLVLAYSSLTMVHSSPLVQARDATTPTGSKSTENDMILKDILMNALRNGGATISLQRARGPQQEVPQQSVLELPQQRSSSESFNSESLNRNYLSNLRVLQQYAALTGSNRLPETYFRSSPIADSSSSGFSRMNSKRAAAMGVDLPDYILHINKGRNFDFSSFREKMQKSG